MKIPQSQGGHRSQGNSDIQQLQMHPERMDRAPNTSSVLLIKLRELFTQKSEDANKDNCACHHGIHTAAAATDIKKKIQTSSHQKVCLGEHQTHQLGGDQIIHEEIKQCIHETLRERTRTTEELVGQRDDETRT